jgi:hypothetical protein
VNIVVESQIVPKHSLRDNFGHHTSILPDVSACSLPLGLLRSI